MYNDPDLVRVEPTQPGEIDPELQTALWTAGVKKALTQRRLVVKPCYGSVPLWVNGMHLGGSDEQIIETLGISRRLLDDLIDWDKRYDEALFDEEIEDAFEEERLALVQRLHAELGWS